MVSTAGEAAADDHEGEGLAPDLGVRGGLRLVQLRHDVVAEADRLLDRLHADAVLGQAGDREGAGDRAGGHDEVVEGQLVGVAGQRRDGGDLARVVHPGHVTGEHLRVLQGAAQRRDEVARRDVAVNRLGKEGQVRHVRPRVDDRDGRLPVAHLLEDAHRGIQADVTTADNEDARTLRGAHIGKYPAPFGAPIVRPVTTVWTPSATLPARIPVPDGWSDDPAPGHPETRPPAPRLSSNDPASNDVPERCFDSASTDPKPHLGSSGRATLTTFGPTNPDEPPIGVHRKAGSPCEEIHEAFSRRHARKSTEGIGPALSVSLRVHPVSLRVAR